MKIFEDRAMLKNGLSILTTCLNVLKNSNLLATSSTIQSTVVPGINGSLEVVADTWLTEPIFVLQSYRIMKKENMDINVLTVLVRSWPEQVFCGNDKNNVDR